MGEEPEHSDEDLMVRVQNADHQAFEQLVRRRTEMFYACAFRVCGQQDEAEDAVQEAFLKLWRKPETWDASKGAKFTTWFYRVVVNTTKDEMRSRKPQAGESEFEMLEDQTERQDVSMEQKEREQALEVAIQALPEK